MDRGKNGDTSHHEEIQAIIDSVEESVPSTLVFVSGGSYVLGSLENEDISSNAPTGTLVEYKISQNQRKQKAGSEMVSILDSSPSKPFEHGKSMEIDDLVTEFKSKRRDRPQQYLSKREKQQTFPSQPYLKSAAALGHTSNLKVSGLIPSVTPELLTKVFSCYGPVLSAKVMIPRDERIESKTCGFVLFADASDAETAKMERDGSVLHGNTINLDWAAPPDPKRLSKMLTDFRDSLYIPQSGSSSNVLTNCNDHYSPTSPRIVPSHLFSGTSPLSDADRASLIDILQSITPSRKNVNSAMEWAMEHQISAPEIVDTISHHLLLHDGKQALNIIGCFFVISDILHNAQVLSSSAPDVFDHAWLFPACFYSTLPRIIPILGNFVKNIPGRISSQFVSEQLMSTLSTWRKSVIFMPRFLDYLCQLFLHPTQERSSKSYPNAEILGSSGGERPPSPSKSKSDPLAVGASSNEDLDGTPISTYPIFGGLAIDFESFIQEELSRFYRPAK